MEKKSRKSFDRDYKKRIVSEYLSGKLTAQQIADREGIERFQVYAWKQQLEQRAKKARYTELAEAGHNADDVRRMMELEEELEAYKAKVAEQSVMIDLLKKLHPSFQCEKKSSGYVELKRRVLKSKGRVK